MAAKRTATKTRRSRASTAKRATAPRETDALAASGLGAADFDLDKVIHERARLAIMSLLAVHAELSFGEVKRHLDLTDGNLSVHARILEDAGYLETLKTTAARKPRTSYRLTRKGRKTFSTYLDRLESIIRATR